MLIGARFTSVEGAGMLTVTTTRFGASIPKNRFAATGDTMPVMAASGAAGALPAAPVEVVAPAPAFAAVGQSAADAEVVLAPAAAGEPDSYVVPALPASPGRPMSSAQLANFVVAHSEFSGSLSRRGMLSALVAGDASVTPVEPRPAPDATVPVEAP
jgi:hypothetical protein